MKKLQQAEKLSLNKQKISQLSEVEASNVKGGFTYSLSLGAVCKLSIGLGASNAYECGEKYALKYQQ